MPRECMEEFPEGGSLAPKKKKNPHISGVIVSYGAAAARKGKRMRGFIFITFVRADIDSKRISIMEENP